MIKQPSIELLDSETFTDAPFQDKNLISKDFGLLLLSMTNYTLIKFFLAFDKTNIKMINKTSSLINNIMSFSRD